MTSVDTHAHIFRRGLNLAAQRRYAPDYDVLAEDYLAQLDAHGIERGVLVQPSFLGHDNSFMLEALARYPDRLRGIAMLPPDVTDHELASLDERGVVGLRLNLVGLPLPDLRAEPWPGLARRLGRLGWQVELHREARDLERLIGPLVDAGVAVVVDHFGRPDPALGTDDPGFRHLLSTARSGRVWVKLSGAYRNGQGEAAHATAIAAAAMLRDAFGPERLLWGSDWPHTQHEDRIRYGDPLRDLDAWVPDATEREIILSDTPSSLFRFGASG